MGLVGLAGLAGLVGPAEGFASESGRCSRMCNFSWTLAGCPGLPVLASGGGGEAVLIDVAAAGQVMGNTAMGQT